MKVKLPNPPSTRNCLAVCGGVTLAQFASGASVRSAVVEWIVLAVGLFVVFCLLGFLFRRRQPEDRREYLS